MSGRSRSSRIDRSHLKGSGERSNPPRRPTVKPRAKVSRPKLDSGKDPKQPRYMPCSADRKEQRCMRSRTLPVGSGTVYAASFQRASGNRAGVCARSNARANACTGSRAKPTRQLSTATSRLLEGAEEFFLLLPIEHAGYQAYVSLEHTVRAFEGGRKKQQLFLNIRRQLGQLQDLAQPRPAHMPHLGQFPIVANRAIGDQGFEPEGQRHQTADAWDACRTQAFPGPALHARAYWNR